MPSLDDYLPAGTPRTQAAPSGHLPFSPERMLSRREIEAALNRPAPDCLGMVDGGSCVHGSNAHKTFGHGGALKMCDSMKTNLAAMTHEQQMATLDGAAQILEQNYLAENSPPPIDPALALERFAAAVYETAAAEAARDTALAERQRQLEEKVAWINGEDAA